MANVIAYFGSMMGMFAVMLGLISIGLAVVYSIVWACISVKIWYLKRQLDKVFQSVLDESEEPIPAPPPEVKNYPDQRPDTFDVIIHRIDGSVERKTYDIRNGVK